MTAPPASAAAGLRQWAGLPVLTWPAFDPLPVEAMVTTRHGGVSAGSYATLNLSFAVGDEAANVRENRRRAAAALGGEPADFVFAAQVHGSRAEEVSGAARDAFGEQAQALLRPAATGGPGQWLFDLRAANRHVLRTAGVPDGQIHVAATATGPVPGLFFSHRAERPCGRFALAARLEPR